MTNQQGAPEALRLADEFDWWLARGITIEPRLYDAATELRRLHAENARLAALVGTQQPAPSAAAAITDTEAFQNFHRLLCARFGYVHDESDWRRDQLSLVEHIARQAQPSPAPQADSQPAPVLDMAVMQLAESVGLIGPASRVHDLHAAIQRFHDLICVNATIKAAVMAADAIRGAATSARDYPPLPMQFACTGVFPVYSADQMRAYVDADRAMRAQAAPAAVAQPAAQQPRQIEECYGDCPTNPATCPNPCAFGGRAPSASHGQAPAGESLRTDALCDLSYSHGLKAGWNYCASDDLAGFERAQKIGAEALRTLKSPTAQAAPAAVAGPSEFPHEQMDVMALARYKVMPSHESMFHRHVVVAGDGSQQLYIGREVECENMARKFAGAFLDGAFAFHSMLAAAPTTQPAPHPSPAAQGDALDAARLDWLLWKLPGDAIRYVVGELADTADAAEFRAAIDAARAAQEGKSHDNT